MSHAKEFAEDRFLELRGWHRAGELHYEKTFADVAKSFMHEYDVLTEGDRNERWVKDHYRRRWMHLVLCLGKLVLPQVTAGVLQEYRIGPVAELCRSGYSFKRLVFQKPRGFSNLMLSVYGAGFRSR